MLRRTSQVFILLALGTAGCSGTSAQSGGPPEPEAEQVLLKHWQALQRRDWPAAYELFHPEVTKKKLSLKLFTKMQESRRKRTANLADLRVLTSERAGDDVTVTFNVLAIPAGGGEPVPVSPTHRAMLRKSGEAWRLMTHDLLASAP